MIYGSICSGIEAATVAWEPLGWQAAFFAEIEEFPSAVLKHRWLDVPNLGDFTRIENGTIELLVGGTPCQSFSVAGLRGGLGDDRGNLALEFLRLAQRLRPRWIVWENVPGVLSSWTDGEASAPSVAFRPSDQGIGFEEDFVELVGEQEFLQSADFDTFLSGLGECGYGWSWRVLDAQHFRVPQRRRRVFVVGYFGDWRPAAAVLFERQSLQWDPAPRREKRQSVTHELAPCLGASGRGFERTGDTRGQDAVVACNAEGSEGLPFLPRSNLGKQLNNQTPLVMSFVDVSPTINSGGNVTGGNRPPGTSVDTCETLVAHTLKGEAHDASEDGSGRGVPLVTSVRTAQTSANGHGISEELAHTLDGAEGQAVIIPILEAGARTGRSTEDAGCGSGIGSDGDPMFTLQSGKQHAVCFEPRYFSGREHAGGAPGKLSPALRCSHKSGDTAPTVMAFSAKDHGGDAAEDLAPTLRSGEFDKSHQNGGVMPAVAGSGTAVRRLTPVECARLQGFPDTHCHIPWKLRRIPADEARYLMGHGIECFQAESREPVAGSQPSWFTRCAPDSLIYKALGNSMAVPVMRWIGERIALVEKVLHSGSEAQQLSGFGAIPKTGAIA